MIARLTCHAETPTDAVEAIEVEMQRLSAKRLRLHYVVTGAIRRLALPAQRPGKRMDGLWAHTCFEAFVRGGAREAYYEFNFAPSSDWAAYRFDAYRAGTTSPRSIGDPQVDGMIQSRDVDASSRDRLVSAGFGSVDRRKPPFYGLSATAELKQAADLGEEEPWRLGLSAVIEERNGRLSYWALAFPPGKPDFHHPDCFALELPAARPA